MASGEGGADLVPKTEVSRRSIKERVVLMVRSLLNRKKGIDKEATHKSTQEFLGELGRTSTVESQKDREQILREGQQVVEGLAHDMLGVAMAYRAKDTPGYFKYAVPGEVVHEFIHLPNPDKYGLRIVLEFKSLPKKGAKAILASRSWKDLPKDRTYYMAMYAIPSRIASPLLINNDLGRWYEKVSMPEGTHGRDMSLQNARAMWQIEYGILGSGNDLIEHFSEEQLMTHNREYYRPSFSTNLLQGVRRDWFVSVDQARGIVRNDTLPHKPYISTLNGEFLECLDVGVTRTKPEKYVDYLKEATEKGHKVITAGQRGVPRQA